MRTRAARASRLIGDTYPSAYTHTRPGARVSAGVRELLGDVEAHMREVAEEFDRLR